MILWVTWPNQQCHSTEGQWLVNQVKGQSHQAPISHIFKSGRGVEGLVISTNMWRLDRQTDTRKAAISDISESTYAKVT